MTSRKFGSILTVVVIVLAAFWLSLPGSRQEASPTVRGSTIETGDNRRPAAPVLSGPYRVDGVEITDTRTGKRTPIGTVDLEPVLRRIAAGEKDPHRNDGSVWENRSGTLPRRPRGYYREYVVPTPGLDGPGPQRLVLGEGGEIYYTFDHYDTFIRLG